MVAQPPATGSPGLNDEEAPTTKKAAGSDLRTSAAPLARAAGAGLTQNTAAEFAHGSERRRRVVDIIGFGGATVSSVLFVAPLAGWMVPTAIPIGLVCGCLAIFVVGRTLNDRRDRHALRELGLTLSEAEEAMAHYSRARARIPNGAKSSARESRLARALLTGDD